MGKHESEKLQGEVEIANVRDTLNAKRTEAERELRRRERLEKELAELKQTLDGRDRNLREVKDNIKVQEEKKAELEKELREQKQSVLLRNKEEETVLNEIDKLKKECA